MKSEIIYWFFILFYFSIFHCNYNLFYNHLELYLTLRFTWTDVHFYGSFLFVFEFKGILNIIFLKDFTSI